MSFQYQITTGRLSHDGILVGNGYSGVKGPCRNNPNCCDDHNIGPIPPGNWTIGAAYDDQHRGPCVLPLKPADDTQTFGRSGFLIHGDSATGNASTGCIILGPIIRKYIRDSGDQELKVIP